MIQAPAVMRVLVADDDPEACALLVSMLASLGHEVVAEAETGEGAVTQTRSTTPDVVLLDVHMPHGSGIDAAREIAADLPTTAVLLLTGDDAFSLSPNDAAETAAISFLAKPTKKNALDSALRLAVARAQALTGARDDAERAQTRLAERKVIERAKGILMRRTGGSEQEAWRILQRTSQDRSKPMAVIAQEVIDSEPTPPRT